MGKLFVSPTAPLVIDLCRGNIGTFLEKERAGEAGRINIRYRPLGFTFKEELLRNISVRGGIVPIPATHLNTEYDWLVIVDDGVKDPPPIIESHLKLAFSDVLDKMHAMSERHEMKSMALDTKEQQMDSDAMKKIEEYLNLGKDKKDQKKRSFMDDLQEA